MSDIFQTLIQCYDALNDPTGRSNPAAATQTLMQIYEKPSSFEALIHFVLTNGIQETYKQNCVVHIGLLFKKYFNQFSSDAQTSIFVSLLKILVLPDSRFVRNYIRYFVQTAMKPEFLPTAASFVAQQQQNINEIGLEASLYVLTMMIGFQSDLNNIVPTSLQLIEQGLNSSSNDVKLAAVLHGLIVANLIQTAEGAQLLLRYIQCGFQLIVSYVSTNDMNFYPSFEDLIKGLTFLFDQGPENINLQQILETCLDLLVNPQIILPFRSRIQILTDTLIVDYIDLIAENEGVIKMILQAYFQYAQMIFDPKETSFDLQDHSVFSSIAVEFASYPDILDLMWKIIVTIFNKPEGLFASISAIIFSLSDGVDYYQSKITELSQIFIAGLKNPIMCINEAAALAIGELALSQKKQIKSVSNNLIQTLLAKLTQFPNPEFVNSIAKIVQSAKDIGNAFQPIFAQLNQLLSVNDITMQYSIFECLYALVRYSPKQARQSFQPIYAICSKALSAPNQLDQLKGPAISILSFLMESSPKLFSPYVTQIHQLIFQNFIVNDPHILYESITAYGHLLQHFSDQLQSTISTVLPKLIEFASKDIAEKTQTEQEIFSGEDIDLDSKIEPIINVVTASIRVAAYALSVYPALIQTYLKPIMDAIQKQLSSGDYDCFLGCAKGCGNLILGIQKLGLNDQTKPLFSNIVFILSQIAASECGYDAAGEAFTAISDMIAIDEVFGILCCYDHLGSILGSVRAVFSGEMLYQQKKVKYVEELHQPAMRVVREIIAAMKNNSIKVVQDLIPLFNGLIRHKSNEMCDLMLQFFGDLVYWASEATDDELKRNTFILAYDAIEKRNSPIGFGVVKQLAMKAPHIISNNLQNLLNLIKAQLEKIEDPPTESLQSIQDNAESALAMIAMNILKDQFPLNVFLPIALSRMPAQLEVEENNDHIAFFLWLFEKAANLNIMQQSMPLFTAVPIRMFSDPFEKLEEYCYSPENINKMQSILKQFATMPNFQNIVKEVCGNDEFKIESVLEALN